MTQKRLASGSARTMKSGSGGVEVPGDAVGAEGEEAGDFGGLVGRVAGVEVEVDAGVGLDRGLAAVEGDLDAGAFGGDQHRPVVLDLLARDVSQGLRPELRRAPHVRDSQHHRTDFQHAPIVADGAQSRRA